MAHIATYSDSPLLTADQQSQFAERLERYRGGVEAIYMKFWTDSQFTHNPGGYAIIDDGKRFAKVLILERRWLDRNDKSKGEVHRDALDRSQIHSFIDKLTGDVLKPASYKVPAKNARGNIFDAHYGLSRVNHFGPEYLK